MPPAPLANPATAFPLYRWESAEGAEGLAYAGQGSADFVVKNAAWDLPGPLGAFGRSASQYNAALLHSEAIKRLFGELQTVGGVTFKVTKEVASHMAAYTIAHELGWHKIGGQDGEGSAPPVHIGVNDWTVIIPAELVYNGIFPPFLNKENEKIQLQMRYLTP